MPAAKGNSSAISIPLPFGEKIDEKGEKRLEKLSLKSLQRDQQTGQENDKITLLSNYFV